MTDRWAYYLAAFADGEGCFRWGGTARASVTNSYPWSLLAFQHFFGGKIRTLTRIPDMKAVYEWEVSGAEARAYGKAISPFLREKRRQADLMVMAGTFPKGSPERDQCLKTLKELKHYEYPL